MRASFAGTSKMPPDLFEACAVELESGFDLVECHRRLSYQINANGPPKDPGGTISWDGLTDRRDRSEQEIADGVREHESCVVSGFRADQAERGAGDHRPRVSFRGQSGLQRHRQHRGHRDRSDTPLPRE